MKNKKLLLLFSIFIMNVCFAQTNPVCDTRDIKNIRIDGDNLKGEEAGKQVVIKADLSHYKSFTEEFSDILNAIGPKGSLTTQNPLTLNESSLVDEIEAFYGGNEQVAAGLFILQDKNGQEVARFFSAGGDFARCTIRHTVATKKL